MSTSASTLQEQQGGDEDYSSGLISSDEDFMEGVVDVLFLKPDFSDVVFVVGRQRFHAHRAILAFRSEYFKAMLYGGLKESSEREIKLKSTDPAAFRVVLKYIYSVEIDLSDFNVEEVLAVLRLAHEYDLIKLQEAITDYLKNIMNVDIYFTITETSTMLSLEGLTEWCQQFCDENAVELLKRKELIMLPSVKLMEMLSRDSFYAPEINIFYALTEWIRARPVMKPAELRALFKRLVAEDCLRLHLMSQDELLTTVRGSALFKSNPSALDTLILDAFQKKAKGTGSRRIDPRNATNPPQTKA